MKSEKELTSAQSAAVGRILLHREKL